jgi:hypothetical protein
MTAEDRMNGALMAILVAVIVVASAAIAALVLL